MGIEKKANIIHMIDLNLATKYVKPAGQLKSFRDNIKNLTGNIRFSSVNAQSGIIQTRRDDL